MPLLQVNQIIMKKVGLVLLLWVLVWGWGVRPMRAQEEVVGEEVGETETSEEVAAEDSEADENITETGSEEVIYRLESVLEEQEVGDWNGFNGGRKLVRLAIDRGAPANTIVLLLLLPLVATLVSFLHYVFGLSGYGIFMPTMIAVAFLATGVLGGLLLFALILVVSMLCRVFLKKLRLHFLTSRTLNLLFISLATFGLMMVTSYADLMQVGQISIFPVLFLILLAEEFVRTQLLKSKNEAQKLMLGTLVLAISGAAVMNIRRFQEMVLLNPDAVILGVLVVNLLIGNYKGIRFSEIGRFRKAIRVKSDV